MRKTHAKELKGQGIVGLEKNARDVTVEEAVMVLEGWNKALSSMVLERT